MKWLKWPCISAGTFAADYAAKRYLERTRKITDEPTEYLDGRILVRRYTNEGSIFEKLVGRPKLARNLSAVAFGAVLAGFLHNLFKPGRTLMKLGYALMLGGGASNFFDRCTRDGVTDYLSIAPKKHSWVRNVVFNLADVAIFSGLFFATLGILFGKNKDCV